MPRYKDGKEAFTMVTQRGAILATASPAGGAECNPTLPIYEGILRSFSDW